MKKILIISLGMLVLWTGCGNKNAEKTKIIEKNNTTQSKSTQVKQLAIEDFITYYVEAAKIQEKYSSMPDSIALKLIDLQKNLDITEEDIHQFKSTYKDDQKNWQQLWEKIETKINLADSTSTRN